MAKNQEVQRRLRPLVIRHVRDHTDERREVYTGAEQMGDGDREGTGIPIAERALLPFLLAALTQALLAISSRAGGDARRAYFAEGLASSFEAYARTRSDRSPVIDGATGGRSPPEDPTIGWYLRHIDQVLPDNDERAWAGHLKVAATVRRVIELWALEEKVLVFCFYIHTGRALRSHISGAIRDRLLEIAAGKLGCSPADVVRIETEIERIQSRLADPEAPAAKAAQRRLDEIFRPAGLPRETAGAACDAVLPFLRTPSFLIRRFDLRAADRAEAFEAALEASDASGLTVARRLAQFAEDLAERTKDDQAAIIAALHTMPTRRIGADPGYEMDDAAGASRESILPKVRLANGQVPFLTRERLMHGFNTPFFPEVLISSAVMAEGVDLHRSCRHVIHHDLDWNPSTIEQRTGRIDRLGSKAERSHQPVVVNEPYMAGTQDEKQFRVMKDRERWFKVVMGEKLQLDEATTDRLADRPDFPLAAARALAIDLAVDRSRSRPAATVPAALVVRGTSGYSMHH